MSNFNMKALTDSMLNPASKEMAQDSFKVENIPFEDVFPNPQNDIFEIGNIDTLAQDIDAEGLSQNFVVRPDEDHPGKYLLISGHRRYAAIAKIHNTDPDRYKYIPCKIETDIKNKDDEIIRIIMSNCTSRVMSDGEKLIAYNRLTDALNAKKKRGEHFRRRDFIAEALRMSTGQVAKLKNISEHLTPSLKKRIHEGNLSIDSADNIASLPQEKQEEVEQKLTEKDKESTTKPVKIPITATDTSDTGDTGDANKTSPKTETNIDSDDGDNVTDTEPIDEKIPQDSHTNQFHLNDVSFLQNTYKYFRVLMIPNEYIEIPSEKAKSVKAAIDAINEDCKKLKELVG